MNTECDPLTFDLFEEFSNRCPICLMGNPVLIDDTDNPDRAMISLHTILALECDACGWKTPGHVECDNVMDILNERWNETYKVHIASARYRLGISIIANGFSAWSLYFENQMVA